MMGLKKLQTALDAINAEIDAIHLGELDQREEELREVEKRRAKLGASKTNIDQSL